MINIFAKIIKNQIKNIVMQLKLKNRIDVKFLFNLHVKFLNFYM